MKKAAGKYSDIIDLPHHTSKKHPRMSMEARAAQFAPFAALTGHGEAIQRAEEAFAGYVSDTELRYEDIEE